jgi:hypothetical protein
MNPDAYGGWINSPALKTFFGELLDDNLLDDERYPEAETKAITIDKLTGRAISSNTPSEFQESTIGYVHNLPSGQTWDGQEIKID